MTRRVLIALSLVGCLALGASAQQQPPTFRSSTRLVVSTVTVKDKEGKVIEGLTAKDFVVTEDNERQEIAFVEFQRLAGEPVPGNAAALTPAPAAPAARAVPAARGRQRRRAARLPA